MSDVGRRWFDKRHKKGRGVDEIAAASPVPVLVRAGTRLVGLDPAASSFMRYHGGSTTVPFRCRPNTAEDCSRAWMNCLRSSCAVDGDRYPRSFGAAKNSRVLRNAWDILYWHVTHNSSRCRRTSYMHTELTHTSGTKVGHTPNANIESHTILCSYFFDRCLIHRTAGVKVRPAVSHAFF